MLDKIGDWIWERVISELAALKAAPVTAFLLFLLAGWGGFEVSEKLGDTEVKNLKSEIGSKDGIIGQKDSEISSLKFKIDHPDQKPAHAETDPDGIYQLGNKVCSATQIIMKLDESQIKFGMLNCGANFDPSAEFQYRTYIVKMNGLINQTIAVVSGVKTSSYIGVSTQVVRVSREPAP